MNLFKSLIMNIFRAVCTAFPVRQLVRVTANNGLHRNIYSFLFPLLLAATLTLLLLLNYSTVHSSGQPPYSFLSQRVESGLGDKEKGSSLIGQFHNSLKSRGKRFIESEGGDPGRVSKFVSSSDQFNQQYQQANINNNYKTISKQQLETWTTKFGGALFEFGRSVTKYSELQGRFQQSNGGEVKKIDLPTLVREFSNEFYKNFKEKVEAIKKVANWAEERALEFNEKKAMGVLGRYHQAPDHVGIDEGGSVSAVKDRSVEEESKKKKKKSKKKSKDKKSKKEEEMQGDQNMDFTEASVFMNDFYSADEEESSDDADAYFENAKRIPEFSPNYIYDPRFQTKVNNLKSAVHVPTPIDYSEKNVKDAIGWSTDMDELFRSNFRSSPTLLWQYFGSSTGFLRQYPAARWPNDNSEKSDPDLYDARMRPWYVNAANSPKNVIILHDVSGSMTGLRREIAKHVVYTILDTLTENDFVNVFNFSDETWAIVPCFGMKRLVMANLENIREFKIALDQDKTAGIANFTSALNAAFDTLQRNFNEEPSANCNQAIMLITDGSPYYFKEIFKAKQNPMHQVRMFTYLIGRDQTDAREIKWMACTNKGYYAHVATLGEVQEKVLKYLPVMSRPMDVHWTPVYADVAILDTQDWLWDEKQSQRQRRRSERYKEFLHRLFYNTNRDEEPEEDSDSERENLITNGERTSDDMPMEKLEELKNRIPYLYKKKRKRRSEFFEYIDIDKHQNDEDFEFTTGGNTETETATEGGDVEGEKGDQERGVIRKKVILTRKKVSTFLDTGLLTVDEYELRREQARIDRIRRETRSRWGPERVFRFMISVSYPVFDMRNSTKSAESEMPERIANFLGVAGTDFDIEELRRQVASPFKLGVNGYAFIVNNNGHIVFHPDWRPLIEEDYILKPNYNTVDISEVEIVDDSEEEDTTPSSHENREFFKIYNRNNDYTSKRKANGKNGYGNNYRNNLTSILDMRKEMIDQEQSYKNLKVKLHRDGFKRIAIQSRTYEYRKIEGTPYTLGISISTGTPYRFHGEIEISRVLKDYSVNVTRFFTHPSFDRFFNNPFGQMKNIKLMSAGGKQGRRFAGNKNWKLNPDWTYCDIIRFGTSGKYGHLDPEMFRNRKRWKEDLILEYLERIMTSDRSWAWRNTNIGISPGLGGYMGMQSDQPHAEFQTSSQIDDVYTCDRELVQSLVFDANITQIFVSDDEYEHYEEETDDAYHHKKGSDMSSRRIKYIDKNESQIIQMYGALVAFVATRTGLTRWIHISNMTKRNLKGNGARNKYRRNRRSNADDIFLNEFLADAEADFEMEMDKHESFMNLLNEQLEDIIGTRATDEIWYKRAVERYEIDPDSFVFSVPFDAGTTVVGTQNGVKRTDALVMASRAIFAKASNTGGYFGPSQMRGAPTVSLKQAPVAVVGILFNHSVWAERFTEITSTCIDGNVPSSGSGFRTNLNMNYPNAGPNPNLNCTQVRTCASDEFDCFILDDNGFIMYSEKPEDTGRFFGEVDGMVMEMLVNAEVYKRTSIIDYQGVCLHPLNENGNAGTALGDLGSRARNYFNLIIGNTVLGYLYGMSSWAVSNIVSNLASFILRFELESGLFFILNLLGSISGEATNGKKDSIRSALYHYANLNDNNPPPEGETEEEATIRQRFQSIKYADESFGDDDEATVETLPEGESRHEHIRGRAKRSKGSSKKKEKEPKVEVDFILADDFDEESEHLIEEGHAEAGVGLNSLPYIDIAAMNKTRLRPCDKEFKLYTYGNLYNTRNFSYNGFLKKCGYSGCNGHFNVHIIPHTNLIMVVTDGRCRCSLNATSIKPTEVNYVDRFLNGKHFIEKMHEKEAEQQPAMVNGKMSSSSSSSSEQSNLEGGEGSGLGGIDETPEKVNNHYEDWSYFYGTSGKKFGEISGEIKFNGETSVKSQICRMPLTQLYRRKPSYSQYPPGQDRLSTLHKMNTMNLPMGMSEDVKDGSMNGRVNPEGCYAYNPEEEYLVEDCGRAPGISLNFQIISILTLFTLLFQYILF